MGYGIRCIQASILTPSLIGYVTSGKLVTSLSLGDLNWKVGMITSSCYGKWGNARKPLTMYMTQSNY